MAKEESIEMQGTINRILGGVFGLFVAFVDLSLISGGKSAIDIWAIKNDCLSVFELKEPRNRPLGISS